MKKKKIPSSLHIQITGKKNDVRMGKNMVSKEATKSPTNPLCD